MKTNQKEGFKGFLKRKNVNISLRVYLMDAMSAMVFGLFASLLIGTIFSTLGEKLNSTELIEIANYAKSATGAVLGVSIAHGLQAPPLVLLSAATVGIAGNTLGGPVGAFLATIIATEFGKMVSKETKVDLLVTPSVTIVIGVIMAQLIGPGVSSFMNMLGGFIMKATEMQPIFMGMLVAVLVGMLLTLPISSAAICVMLNLGGLAAGAATAGCCAQMIGFAVMSFKENGWAGIVAQGLGTSMLQVPNIIKNPRIWIPTILTSLITGPLATVVFKMENIPTGAGMGTCGLVGPLGVVTAMSQGGSQMMIGILLICFVLPAILTFIFSEGLRKMGWIKENDLKLDL